MYAVSDSGELMGKKAVMGALTLYLDFINLFIMLLRLFGQEDNLFCNFFQLVFLIINLSHKFLRISPFVSVIKYFKFLFFGLKFLHL